MSPGLHPLLLLYIRNLIISMHTYALLCQSKEVTVVHVHVCTAPWQAILNSIKIFSTHSQSTYPQDSKGDVTGVVDEQIAAQVLYTAKIMAGQESVRLEGPSASEQ